VAALCVAALAACRPVDRQSPDQSVRPGINREYETTPVDTWVERFEAESREIYRERERVAEAAGIKPGMAIADIGAGSGFFTELFARRVGPSGKVYAVDINEEFVERIDQRAKANGLANVTTVLCTDKDAKLPPASIDLAFVCDTYHHFEYPARTLASIRRALRPGGVLVVIDFERVDGKSRKWVLDHVRAGKETTKSEILRAGFEFLDQPATPYLEENYLLRFRRK
jgi:ubiquinone/menaquinone biosynthesis C-methylase UbiE